MTWRRSSKPGAKPGPACHAATIDKLLTAASAEEFVHHWQRLRDHFDLFYAPGDGALEAVANLRQAILQAGGEGASWCHRIE